MTYNHHIGGAIALITSVYLPLHLPTTTVFRTITYGMPRVRLNDENHSTVLHAFVQVGNQAFANYVDAHLHVTHINNQYVLFIKTYSSLSTYYPSRDDIVPIVPGKTNLLIYYQLKPKQRTIKVASSVFIILKESYTSSTQVNGSTVQVCRTFLFLYRVVYSRVNRAR